MAFAKIKLTAQIRLETGLHIGTSNAFAAIGATDSPVIKDLVLVSRGKCVHFWLRSIMKN